MADLNQGNNEQGWRLSLYDRKSVNKSEPMLSLIDNRQLCVEGSYLFLFTDRKDKWPSVKDRRRGVIIYCLDMGACKGLSLQIGLRYSPHIQGVNEDTSGFCLPDIFGRSTPTLSAMPRKVFYTRSYNGRRLYVAAKRVLCKRPFMNSG